MGQIDLWSKSAASNSNADASINWQEGQPPSTVNNSARGMMAAVAEWLEDVGGVNTTAGTSTAYTLTTSRTITAFKNGLVVSFRADETCGAAPTLNVDSLGAKSIVSSAYAAEAAVSAGSMVANGIYHCVYNTSANGGAGAWVLLTPSIVTPFGQCRLDLSAGSLRLLPFQGNRLTVNGTPCIVPSAGVTLAATSLTPGTTYYIYAVATSGAVSSLEASATAYATHTDGTAIKTGDATRALVGMARCVTGPAWADTAAQRLVVSWHNRREISGTARFSVSRTTTSTSYVELNSEIRIEFLAWPDHATAFFVSGGAFNSGPNTVYTSIGLDGTTPQDVLGIMSSVNVESVSMSHFAAVAEGYHYATVLGRVTAGTGTWFTNTDNAGERFTLKLVTRG